MSTNEIVHEIAIIREVLDQINVIGTKNAKALAVADEHCRILIDQIQNGSKNEETEDKD